ncbi:MAG: hypothetical protein RL042_589 [Nitrospirota bacterium]
MVAQSACSVYKAATQPPPADLQGVGVGTSRQELIQRLGAPKFSDTDAQGRKQDSFEFYSGMHSASKSRIILYVAADVFTLTLAELILWPMELTVMERATCNGFATYDQSQKVEAWKVSQKDGVQDC